MRRKKRYVLLKELPAELPEDSKFLFQTHEGFVLKVSPREAEHLRGKAIRISGALRKVKFSKTPK